MATCHITPDTLINVYTNNMFPHQRLSINRMKADSHPIIFKYIKLIELRITVLIIENHERINSVSDK